MLNQSSQAQMNLSEEDNSGSDAGSEVSLEPETDRFGFIVTNGSTSGSVGPSPELVRQREAKWINLIGQWDRILFKKSSKIKVQCQKGIPASLRAKCWPLLCGANEKMKQNKNLYQSLDLQKGLQSWVDVIERDLDRQFPFHEMFLSKDGHGQRGLFRVLKAYTQYQPEEGYCQAQGPVAAVLLMNMPAEEAFWCLVQISEQYLPGYYSPLLEGVLFDAAMLSWVLKRTCPAAHKHLQQHGVEPLMFATDWLMCLFTRHLPFNTLLRVWDLFFCYGVRVLLQVAVVLVRRVLGRTEQRKQCQGQMETLERLRGVREQVQEEDDAFIAEVCSVPLSSKDLEKRTEKELEKWRKERPSSTFDPRGRCHGYRMAWTKVREKEEEQDRKERETGNLSVPLGRSASTLSLSPSLIHKKWKKGGKVNTGDWVGGNKVVRHFSMGAKEDWRSSGDLDFEKERDNQEKDAISERHKTQSESKLAEEPKLHELLGEPKTKNASKEHIEQVIKEEQTEILDQTVENTTQLTEPTSHCEDKEKLETTNQSHVLEGQSHSNNTQETDVKDRAEQTDTPVTESKHTTAVENNSTEVQGEAAPGTNLEMQAREDTETENVQQLQVATVTGASDARSETRVNSEEERDVEASTVKDESQTTDAQQEQEKVITKREEDAFAGEDHNIESLVETETEEKSRSQAKTETDLSEEVREETEENVAANGDAEIIQTDAEKHTESEMETEKHTESQTDAEKHTESEMETEKHTESQTETEKHTESQTETEKHTESQIDAEKHTESQTDAEKHTESQTDAEKHTESQIETEKHTESEMETEKHTESQTDAEKYTESEMETEKHTESQTDTEEKTFLLSSSECIQHKEDTDLIPDAQTEAEVTVSQDMMNESNETTVIEPAHGKEENAEAVHTEMQSDRTNAEETQTTEDTADSVPLTQDEALKQTTESDSHHRSSVHVSTFEMKAPELPLSQVSAGAMEETEHTEDVEEDTAVQDDVFTSAEATNSTLSDSNKHDQDKDPPLTKDQSEPQNSGLEYHGSRSSGDLCVRKSSSSRESRMARRLSEDLFTTPQKTDQSQLPMNHPDSQHRPVNTEQTAPGVTTSVDGIKDEAIRQEQQPDNPKRFGLFRKLRGEHSKNAKAEGGTKMQVPKILIQDFSDGTGAGKTVEIGVQEKLNSKERRRKRRERERKEKEEERMKKKKEKELEKERRKPQTRGKSFQGNKEKSSDDVTAKTGSQTLRYSSSYAESYF